jgi:hypothetical protein
MWHPFALKNHVVKLLTGRSNFYIMHSISLFFLSYSISLLV